MNKKFFLLIGLFCTISGQKTDLSLDNVDAKIHTNTEKSNVINPLQNNKKIRVIKNNRLRRKKNPNNITQENKIKKQYRIKKGKKAKKILSKIISKKKTGHIVPKRHSEKYLFAKKDSTKKV